MTTLTASRQRYLPIIATFALLVGAYGFGAAQYEAFASGQVVLNILIDNAFLLVVAIGMTFVILTGGIDLSVGAVVALSTLVSARLLAAGVSPLVVLVLVLVIGGTLGLGMGAVIHYFELQPFIVTLAGMFLARGLCYTISVESISITDGFFTTMAQTPVSLPGGMHVSTSVVIAVIVLAVAAYVLHFTRLGRTVYAIGGSEQSAMLMGLPVARTKITVYAISGLCSALGGVLLAFYTLSGNALHAVGMELDAIAAVVIGGTILTGGTGYVLGTVLGVLVLGIIQTLITFDGTLSSWWTKIVIGALLFVFIVLQRLVSRRAR
ncbi:galactofuranose ABC transporter, permease protein YjfF [Kibdelosporangium persicum]|uniref:Permease component of ABC-type sugar transport system n=1 Tax=Kibdelosporangium persicum TaxID=2698649 RepID=A0ABX2F6V5_9PSEU|nr:galactofuranose ABC transporter, permease protein YjfF [Kibdelosporangium persicum]NRN67084.1 Permease component of ABC-type sugar transport system [Kibdelosporangium persicum]